MSKHTPGPWEVDLETGEINAQGAVLGTIYGADDFPCCDEDIDEEYKANARLIAATPDLLAACKTMVKLWDAEHPDDPCACMPEALNELLPPLPCELCVVRAAIAKGE